MYSYASGSAAASTLMPFTAPPQNTNPAGLSAQGAAVGQAAGTSAGAHSSSVLSQLVSRVPNVLQGLASGTGLGPATGLGDPLSGSMGSILGNSADLLNFGSGLTFVASGVVFLLGPLLAGPIAGGLPISSLGWSGAELGASGVASLLAGAPGALSLGGVGMSAGLGRAASIGGLSVPPTWAGTAPALTRATMALPEPALVGLPQAEVDALGPGYGGMLPGSLMAAAAGGGGAAGGGWAGTRAGAATQSRGAMRTPYGPRPTVIPQAAREASVHAGTHGPAMWPDQRPQVSEGTLGESVRGEINDLRKQLAELAMERDALMRSLAFWARGATGQ